MSVSDDGCHGNQLSSLPSLWSCHWRWDTLSLCRWDSVFPESGWHIHAEAGILHSNTVPEPTPACQKEPWNSREENGTMMWKAFCFFRVRFYLYLLKLVQVLGEYTRHQLRWYLLEKYVPVYSSTTTVHTVSSMQNGHKNKIFGYNPGFLNLVFFFNLKFYYSRLGTICHVVFLFYLNNWFNCHIFPENRLLAIQPLRCLKWNN